MTIKSAGQILISEIRSAVDRLSACVTPIYGATDRLEPQLVGSAILLELSGVVFLCTAEHVIYENKSSTLYVDGPLKLEIFEGDFFRSKEHDIAVARLSDEQVSILSKYRPLKADEIASHAQTSKSVYVEFLGFPETKNRKIYKTKVLKRHFQVNGCSVIEITERRVRISFDKRKNVDSTTGERVTSPDPYGMSGGAMFGTLMDKDTIEGSPKPKLIGTSTDKPSNQEVFGTPIAITLAMIRDGFSIQLDAELDPTHIKTTSR